MPCINYSNSCPLSQTQSSYLKHYSTQERNKDIYNQCKSQDWEGRLTLLKQQIMSQSEIHIYHSVITQNVRRLNAPTRTSMLAKRNEKQDLPTCYSHKTQKSLSSKSINRCE